MSDNIDAAKSIRAEFGRYIRMFREQEGKRIGDNYSQTRLAKRVISCCVGIDNIHKLVSQKRISRLENGDKVKFPIPVIRELVKICDIPEDITRNYIKLMGAQEEINCEPVIVNINEFSHLLTSSSHGEFDGYMGEYYCFFHSTNSADPKLVEGRFIINRADETHDGCIAKLDIYENGRIIKRYDGQFFLNNHFHASYCILVGEDKQEVCMLISNHHNVTKGKNYLNIALVLTTSAGQPKRPTMHRMVFSMDPLSALEKQQIHALLKLNTDTISIPAERLDDLYEEMKTKQQKGKNRKKRELYASILECIEYIKNNALKKTYYIVEESTIYDSTRFSDDQKVRSQIVAKLREQTDTAYYNKISDTATEICAKLIKNKQKKNGS